MRSFSFSFYHLLPNFFPNSVAFYSLSTQFSYFENAKIFGHESCSPGQLENETTKSEMKEDLRTYHYTLTIASMKIHFGELMVRDDMY